MIITDNIFNPLAVELQDAKSIWIASAMISKHGWNFIQKNITKDIVQHYLIGIDLATDPFVFESILSDLNINAMIYECKYTFHPKVYIVKKADDSLVAFVGSSNTTSWGLEKNIEMNFRIEDQTECNKLVDWFDKLYTEGYLITKEFLDDYNEKYVNTNQKRKEIENDTNYLTELSLF
ncbi:phospholipase D-like domain-containing protein [Flammeovirga sp. EKP202]|uniref:phospholipase D-like domain-containing protein n=1 Tax=Flammeovirga sp. EKP202 TaxID=2770592 RepID=UPI00165F8645|nr:phospholipase D-like domain-containing protein [Flammeovirga sp. EKP202]MBD0401819.1 NgoFVII family restriction endonuclease [Flammeovirga sp. EKP202]